MTESGSSEATAHIKSGRQLHRKYQEVLATYVVAQRKLLERMQPGTAEIDHDYLLSIGSIVEDLIMTLRVLAKATGHPYLGEGEGALMAADSNHIYPAS